MNWVDLATVRRQTEEQIDGGDRVVNPSLPNHLWIQKDTIIVNHMERVEIEFLANNPGKWFHHCHNLYHMEAGMANVVVYQM